MKQMIKENEILKKEIPEMKRLLEKNKKSKKRKKGKNA